MKRLILACFLIITTPTICFQINFTKYLRSLPGIAERVLILRATKRVKWAIDTVWNRLLMARGLDGDSMNNDALSAGSASQKRLPAFVTQPVPIAEGTVPPKIQDRIDRLKKGDYSWPACKPLLLAGLPGSGKTQLGRYLAQQTDCPLVYESAAGIFAGIENSGTETIYGLFNRARRRPLLSSFALKYKQLIAWVCRRPQPVRKPAIIVLDEFDAIAQKVDAKEVLAGDRPLEEERDKAFNRLLWEVARNPYKENNPQKLATWLKVLPENHVLRILFQVIPAAVKLMPHYSCPPAGILEKTIAAPLKSVDTLSDLFMQLVIKVLEYKKGKLTEEQFRDMHEAARIASKVFSTNFPADSIIPLLHVIGSGKMLEETLKQVELSEKESATRDLEWLKRSLPQDKLRFEEALQQLQEIDKQLETTKSAQEKNTLTTRKYKIEMKIKRLAQDIIPTLSAIKQHEKKEETIDKIFQMATSSSRWSDWIYKKYFSFNWWQYAKDETDALVIATSNKRSGELDPLVHEFFEVVDMQQLTAEQREHVLQFHAKGKRLASDVNFTETAKKTEGFTGDELAAIVNDAALKAALHKQQEVSLCDINAAYDDQIAQKEQAKKRITS